MNYKFRIITILNITRQKINILKPFEEMYFNKKSIDNKEDMNVEIKAIIRGKKLYK